MDYEVVIPAASKDYNKLPYLLSSLHYLDPQPKDYHIIYDKEDDILNLINIFHRLNVKIHKEKDILDLDPTAAKLFRRPQWIYQQFLKLFQNVTETDNYLIIDSDLIFNRPISLLSEGLRPKFFLGNDQHHVPYFKYSKDMFGFGREYDHSFISEIMLMRKSVNHALLSEFHYHHGLRLKFEADHHKQKYIQLNLIRDDREKAKLESIKELYELTCMGATDNWIPADYELYGNFVEKTFPLMYAKEKIKTSMRGRYINQPWTNEDLESYIEEMKGTDYDTFTAHTWI